MGIRILNGGFLTTVQDMGRYGSQETGMAVSGVMDTRAAALADILVGNDENEAVLEVTMMGPIMEFTEDELIAVTGGDLGAKVDGKPLPRYEAVLIKAGQTVSFGGMYGGSRAYMAFAGGLDVAVVMGSRSTNLKVKIGGIEGRKLASQHGRQKASPSGAFLQRAYAAGGHGAPGRLLYRGRDLHVFRKRLYHFQRV